MKKLCKMSALRKMTEIELLVKPLGESSCVRVGLMSSRQFLNPVSKANKERNLHNLKKCYFSRNEKKVLPILPRKSYKMEPRTGELQESETSELNKFTKNAAKNPEKTIKSERIQEMIEIKACNELIFPYFSCSLPSNWGEIIDKRNSLNLGVDGFLCIGKMSTAHTNPLNQFNQINPITPLHSLNELPNSHSDSANALHTINSNNPINLINSMDPRNPISENNQINDTCDVNERVGIQVELKEARDGVALISYNDKRYRVLSQYQKQGLDIARVIEVKDLKIPNDEAEFCILRSDIIELCNAWNVLIFKINHVMKYLTPASCSKVIPTIFFWK